MTEETRDLLIELGTEELPPKALPRLSAAFAEEVERGLSDAGLTFGQVRRYGSPRRLAVIVERLAIRQPDRELERKGPALQAAFDDTGQPTKAALGFARSCGVEIDALSELRTEQGTWLVYRGRQEGQNTVALVPEIVQQALNKLPIPKRMRWGAGSASFVRPVHWLVLLFGDEVIPAEVLGVRSGASTRGHRFHHPDPIRLGSAQEYVERLEKEGRVVVDFDRRRETIRQQVELTASDAGAVPVIDPDLLDEVAALVELPVAVLGSFDEGFLEVPPEALISSMQGHQKYFPLRDASGGLKPQFITIANIESRDPDAVRAGNERVIRPRLADAAFFWEQDRKRALSERQESLKSVVYQAKLGSMYAKSERVAALAGMIAQKAGASIDDAQRAAMLAKCDLATEMVGEFPELQGIMGRYYAAHDREPEAVAVALDEQYMPRFAGDAVASSVVGQVLAVAERADTLVGIFAIGKAPSGDKDPFALRRAALGLMRTLIEAELDIDLHWLLDLAAQQFAAELKAKQQVEAVYDFCLDRLRGYYLEQGVAVELFEAVAACRPTRPLDFDHRLRACRRFVELPEATSLAAANKRIRNILRKIEEPLPAEVEPSALVEPQEKALVHAVQEASHAVQPLFSERRYGEALERLAQLREPVDAFFEHVLVMADDARLRHNRLRLLEQISQLFMEVADVSRLPG